MVQNARLNTQTGKIEEYFSAATANESGGKQNRMITPGKEYYIYCYFRLLETTATYSLNVTDYRPSLARPAAAGTRDAIQDFIRH